MKPKSRGTGDIWSSTGSHQLELAGRSAPGPGHVMRSTVWCSRCQANRAQKGGKRIAGIFFCALHKKAATA